MLDLTTTLAVSVFAVVLSLTALIVQLLSQKKTHEKEEERKRQEEKLFRLYQGIEEMMEEFEEFVHTSKEKIAKTEELAEKLRTVSEKQASLNVQSQPEKALTTSFIYGPRQGSADSVPRPVAVAPVKRGRGRPRKKPQEVNVANTHVAAPTPIAAAALNGMKNNDEVLRLLRMGESVNDVAQKLGRNKGEIILIKDLMKND